MHKRLIVTAVAGLLFASYSVAETLAENPYYQQMQQKLNQASVQAGKAFDQKYPQPRVQNNVVENKNNDMKNQAPVPQRNITPPPPPPPSQIVPVTPVEQKPDVAITKSATEKKDNDNQSFNIFLPPGSNTNK